MDQDNSLNHGVGFPPSPGRFSPITTSESSFPVKTEPSGSSSLPPLGPVASGSMDLTQFSHDVSQMSDNPSRNLGHRRAQSEFYLPDDIGFDFDLGIVGGVDGPSLSDENDEEFVSMCLDMDKFDSSSTTSGFQTGESSSMPGASSVLLGQEETPSMNTRIRHQHSQSMDGSTMVKSEALTSSGEEPSAAESRKSISEAKLAELAVVDPKRAKRIWANRQSAARSKERKMRYISELEKKLKTLQTEASMLSTQLTILQGDTNGLNAENSELKVRLQSVEQQVNLQDALNDSLKDEIQHLKVLTNHMANGGPVFNYPQSFSGNPQYFTSSHANTRQTMSTAQQLQQLQQLQINARRPQQQLMYQQFPQQQQQQPQAQAMMQQREQLLQRSGDMNLRGNMPLSYAQYGNASDMGSRDWK